MTQNINSSRMQCIEAWQCGTNAFHLKKRYIMDARGAKDKLFSGGCCSASVSGAADDITRDYCVPSRRNNNHAATTNTTTMGIECT